ncbi:50S ribosomal protein L13 [Acidaminococcus intestini]|nr:50S ribosomal protein L13 [Acidaminococcus intestini]
MKTYMATPSTIERKWYVVDAADKTLGRLAAEVAKVLRGKHKPTFTPHMDTGDHVIIINADKVRLTGKKLVQKVYFRHSGYLGGDKYTKAGDMLAKNPVRMVELTVRGMVPHNRLGSQIIKKLHVYAGSEHPHAAQKPEVLTIDIR